MLDGSVIGKVGTRASTLVVALSLLLVLGLAVPVQAQPFPEVIPLPNGWQPEGIAVGDGHAFYAGSLADGAIYSGDLRTGEGEVLLPGEEGRVAVGLAFDSSTKNLFVAGGGTGTARVVDTRTAEVLAEYQLTEAASFVNDAVVTGRAAYFTDSFRPVLYKVPLTPSGRLPDPSAVVEIALGGDFEFVAGAFNANGIDATPDGKTLLIINSTTGSLYRVDPCSGEATLIEVSGGELTMGDGILLDGKTLYVVRNRANEIAVVELDARLETGRVVGTITDNDLDVPATIAAFGDALYAVNARFTTPPGPDVEYDVVMLSKR